MPPCSDFFAAERLRGESKYACSQCQGPEEAVRQARVGSAPRMLALHLKRFMFNGGGGGGDDGPLHKTFDRVTVPTQLRLPGAPATRYALGAAVVHIGASPQAGHYVTLARVPAAELGGAAGGGAQWVLFDDDYAAEVDERAFEALFGAGNNSRLVRRVVVEVGGGFLS